MNSLFFLPKLNGTRRAGVTVRLGAINERHRATWATKNGRTLWFIEGGVHAVHHAASVGKFFCRRGPVLNLFRGHRSFSVDGHADNEQHKSADADRGAHGIDAADGEKSTEHQTNQSCNQQILFAIFDQVIHLSYSVHVRVLQQHA